MECPKCHESLETVAVGHVRVERCPRCAGTWYDKEELRVLKDKESQGAYSWISFDLWKDIEKFRARRQQRYSCPRDGGPMTTVHYGDSSIAVDICPACKGMWLDKEEYGEIVRYLESVVDSSSTGEYLEDVREELVELLKAREGIVSQGWPRQVKVSVLQIRTGSCRPTTSRENNGRPKRPSYST